MKIDLGCGTRPQAGFTGVDIRPFTGVNIVADLRQPWPWPDASVDEAYSSHFLEHLTGEERILFFNELYRVLKPGSQARIVTPHWSNACAYGDPTHRWPPVSEWTYFYLVKAWREVNAPHTDYLCDFDISAEVSWEEWLMTEKNATIREFALQRNINSARDLIVTLTRR